MLTAAPQKQNQVPSQSKKSEGFFFQPKLTINQPNDVYEKQADAIADKVMRVPETPSSLADSKPFFSPPAVNINKSNAAKEEPFKKEIKEEETEESIPEIQAKLSFDGSPPPPDDNKENNTGLIQRKCAHCEEGEEEKIQRKDTNSGETVADTSTENYINSLNGKGRSLTEGERKFFEPKMGYDFSNVQLHTNEEASQSAKSINALAYTHGNNIVFGSGQYQPNTDEGKKLLAHELTHVVQQKSDNVTNDKAFLIQSKLKGKLYDDTLYDVVTKISVPFNNSDNDFAQSAIAKIAGITKLDQSTLIINIFEKLLEIQWYYSRQDKHPKKIVMWLKYNKPPCGENCAVEILTLGEQETKIQDQEAVEDRQHEQKIYDREQEIKGMLQLDFHDGADADDQLIAVMKAIDSISKYDSDIYTLSRSWGAFDLTSEEHDSVIKSTRTALKLQLHKAASAILALDLDFDTQYQKMHETRWDRTISWVAEGQEGTENLPNNFILTVNNAHIDIGMAKYFIDNSGFEKAVVFLLKCDDDYAKAHRIYSKYFESLITGAGSAVETLNTVKTVSDYGLYALSLTGGSAILAGSETAIGGSFAVKAADRAVIAAIPAIAPATQTIVESISADSLGQKVDWDKVTLTVMTDIIVGKLNDKISTSIAGKLLAGETSLKIFGYDQVVSGVSTLIQSDLAETVHISIVMTYDKYHDHKNISWDEIAGAVADNLTDPKSAVTKIVTGALFSFLSPKGGEAQSESGKAGEVDTSSLKPGPAKPGIPPEPFEAPLTSTSHGNDIYVGDTNVIRAIDSSEKRSPSPNARESLTVATLKAQGIDPGLVRNVQFELDERGGTQRTFKEVGPVDPKTRIEREAILSDLRDKSVGGDKDQLIVRQALLTEMPPGKTLTFISADDTLINGLARLTPDINPQKLGRYQNVSEYLHYTKGTDTFEVVVQGRHLKVQPIQPIRPDIK